MLDTLESLIIHKNMFMNNDLVPHLIYILENLINLIQHFIR